jgi:trimethyllysine dioxygenase
VGVRWPDEPTTTWISCDTITAVLDPEPPPRPRLWSDPNDAAVSVGVVEQVLEDDTALAAWLGDLATVGFAQLRGFRGGHDEVEALARRIGYPRSTIFGTTWDLASDITGHDDTAYTQSFLAPHTDATYSHDAPGLQMFCCLERDGTGGESIVVDGFALAETLRSEFPDDFAVLTSVDVPAHYIEPGVELRAARPAIRLDRQGTIVQISMNNYDRSPMWLPPAEMAAFYRAYGRLHELAGDESRWVEIGLRPGDVLINDNWRVLHGRRAYTGTRHFVGCYLNHEDFESRRRTNGVRSGHLST